jgi:8-oxo-dGTP diphosphatase
VPPGAVLQHQRCRGKEQIIVELANLSVDCSIFGFQDGKLKVLLIRRSNAYMTSQWALPGHNINDDESAEEAAARILREMSGVKDIYLDQVASFSAVDRVPGYRIVTIAFLALVDIKKHSLHPLVVEAEAAAWYDIDRLPGMALDHRQILRVALRQLRRKFRFEPLGYELLPRKFSLRELQNLYESLYGIRLDNRNFRKRILRLGHLVPLEEKQENVSHRRAILYRFDPVAYQQLRQNGINVDVLPAVYMHRD